MSHLDLLEGPAPEACDGDEAPPPEACACDSSEGHAPEADLCGEAPAPGACDCGQSAAPQAGNCGSSEGSSPGACDCGSSEGATPDACGRVAGPAPEARLCGSDEGPPLEACDCLKVPTPADGCYWGEGRGTPPSDRRIEAPAEARDTLKASLDEDERPLFLLAAPLLLPHTAQPDLPLVVAAGDDHARHAHSAVAAAASSGRCPCHAYGAAAVIKTTDHPDFKLYIGGLNMAEALRRVRKYAELLAAPTASEVSRDERTMPGTRRILKIQVVSGGGGGCNGGGGGRSQASIDLLVAQWSAPLLPDWVPRGAQHLEELALLRLEELALLAMQRRTASAQRAVQLLRQRHVCAVQPPPTRGRGNSRQ